MTTGGSWLCLWSVGCELQREVLCSCNAVFLEGGSVAIVWHNDRERHRSCGTGERHQIASIIGTLLGLAV